MEAHRETVEQVVELPLSEIRPDPNQPRKYLDEESIAELAASIEQGGLYQPITVRPAPEGEGYVIVAGHRRFRAHERLERESIRALVREVDEREAFIIALNENLQREDLTPFDEAEGYRRLIDVFGMNQRQVGEQLGKKESVISETLRFLQLPEEIREEYPKHPVSKSMLIQIARRKSRRAQLEIWGMIKIGEIATVQDARELLARGDGADRDAEPDPGRELSQQLSQLVSSAGKLQEFPIEHFQEKPHEYRRLVDLTATLAQLVEDLRQRLGEPPRADELPPRRRGRKPKALAETEVGDTTEPAEPA